VCYLTLEEPVGIAEFETATVTVSVRVTDNGAWREIGRHEHVPDAVGTVGHGAVEVRAADYGIEPGTTVRVAVLDEAGRVADFVTTPAR
jgi:predicted RNase H-like nuclease (RuvC/YqgF family)